VVISVRNMLWNERYFPEFAILHAVQRRDR
jgi:hypothetical protein